MHKHIKSKARRHLWCDKDKYEDAVEGELKGPLSYPNDCHIILSNNIIIIYVNCITEIELHHSSNISNVYCLWGSQTKCVASIQVCKYNDKYIIRQ